LFDPTVTLYSSVQQGCVISLIINCLSISLSGRDKRLDGGSYGDFALLVKPIGVTAARDSQTGL